MSKYGEAMGVWHIEVGGADLDLKPKIGDNRKLLRIMSAKEYKNDTARRLEAFMDWFLGLLRRDYPVPKDSEEYQEQEEFVEFNVNALFEETLVKFRWSTREELEKQKKESAGELKKLIGDA